MGLRIINSGSFPIAREALEAGVMARLRRHRSGPAGITPGNPTGDGEWELVMRSSHGVPVGVLGFSGTTITDFAVAPAYRRLGIASALVDCAASRFGCTAIRGPFTDDGRQFIRMLQARIPV